MTKPETARRRIFWWTLTAAFVLACAAHLWGLYAPRVDLPSDVDNADKWAHFFGFGVPVALGWWRFPGRRWWVVAVFAVHGVISEMLQSWVLPNRMGDPIDAAADIVGVGLGALVGWLGTVLVRHRHRATAHSTE